jgi:WD40 repeat protein
VRWRRLALLLLAGVVVAAAGTVLAVAVNVATGGTAKWFPPLERHPLWWTAGAAAAGAAASLLVWAAQRWYERALSVLVPAVHRLEPWVVERPAEVDRIVAALRRRNGGTVGITTAVHGAGGFGKTTVAKMVRADRRVLRRFGRRVYWVTLGRDVGKEALVGLVNGLIGQVEPGRAVTFTDARQAGEHLAAVLAAGPQRLLVLDDVWSEDQLAVFPAGRRCARLVTTRIPSLAAGTSVPVKVDQMSETQARALLLAGLPPLPPAVAGGLMKETGRWPLLLRLVNKILADQVLLQPEIAAAAEDLLDRLRRGGALQVDKLTGAAGKQLDVSDPDQRQKAIVATIQASTSLLSPAEYERFAELAVFAEDETIPITLITALWQATGGLDRMTVVALCARLADLALLALIAVGDGGVVTVHDVIRDFLHEELGSTRLAQLHQILLEAVAEGLPSAEAAASGGRGSKVTVTAWWELPESARYLWEHLIQHVLAAGRAGDAEELAVDLRWVEARLERFGPSAPAADLATAGTPRTTRLRGVLERTAHLLAPTDPAGAVVDVLHSRVTDDPDWGPQVTALGASCRRPRLVNRWPLPDPADLALRRVLTGHTKAVAAVAVAPDGSWLASGGDDWTVRIWDVVTGRERATLKGHTAPVAAVAVAPDGSWLASGGWDWTVRIWDAATGRERATLKGDTEDGSWLASGWHWTVRIWDVVTRRERATLKGHTGTVAAVAVAPDGSWLASGSRDSTVRIWDVATGRVRAVLAGHTSEVAVVVVAPDSSWLASGDYDRTVRIWDAATGRVRAVLAGHTSEVIAVVVGPDGSWLASGSRDSTVRIWDVATGRERAVQPGHTTRAAAWAVAVAPDGSWLASGSSDSTVRIWDGATGRERAVLVGHTGTVAAVAVAPDGSWLASGSDDSTVRIWDVATGRERAVLTGHTSEVVAVAVAPDGSWLASADRDRTVRIWDVATRHARALMRVDNDIRTCGWLGSDALAVGGSAGLYLFSFLTRMSPAAAGQ